VQGSDEPDKANEKQNEQSNTEQNGNEPLIADKDVVMAEADVGDAIGMEAFEDVVKPSETHAEPSGNE